DGEDLRSVKRFFPNTVDVGTGIDPNLNSARAYGVPEDRWAEVESLQADSSRSGQGSGSTGLYRQAMSRLPETIHILDDGMRLPMDEGTVTAMWTPGHTYGHSAFVRADDDLLFSGDHVLPTITPNIGLDSGAITHSLGDYLGSLDKIGQLPEDVAVLPAHGFRFTGLHDRRAELVEHHRQRLDEIRARMAATDDHSVYSIAQGLHWSRGFDSLRRLNLFAALAETAAHMHYLGIDIGVGSLVGTDSAGAGLRSGRYERTVRPRRPGASRVLRRPRRRPHRPRSQARPRAEHRDRLRPERLSALLLPPVHRRGGCGRRGSVEPRAAAGMVADGRRGGRGRGRQ